jgi:hypothetical protein
VGVCTVKYTYRLEIGLFKNLGKVIRYDIKGQFHDKRLYMIYYTYKISGVNFVSLKINLSSLSHIEPSLNMLSRLMISSSSSSSSAHG